MNENKGEAYNMPLPLAVTAAGAAAHCSYCHPPCSFIPTPMLVWTPWYLSIPPALPCPHSHLPLPPTFICTPLICVSNCSCGCCCCSPTCHLLFAVAAVASVAPAAAAADAIAAATATCCCLWCLCLPPTHHSSSVIHCSCPPASSCSCPLPALPSPLFVCIWYIVSIHIMTILLTFKT